MLMLLVVAFCNSCTISGRIANKIAKSYEYENGKVLGGDYVKKNRKFVLSEISSSFLKNYDTLVLIESVVALQDYYDCAVFHDSLKYFYQAKGLENPKEIDVNVIPTSKPELAIYIYGKIKQGGLRDILKQGENVNYVHPSSIYLTVIKREGNVINISGYNFHEFVPREKRIELDSIKSVIKKNSSK